VIRPPPGRLRILPALGEGIRLAFARIFVAWPVAFAASLVPLATEQGWARLSMQFPVVESRLVARGIQTGEHLWSMTLPPLLAASLLAGSIVRMRRRRPLDVGRSLVAGLRSAATPILLAAALSVISGLLGSLVDATSIGTGSPGFLVFNFVWLLCYVAVLARVAVAPVVAAQERLSCTAACRRSMALLAGHTWRMMGLVFCALLSWTILFRGLVCGVLLASVLPALRSPDISVSPLSDAFILAEVDATCTVFVAVVLIVVFDRARELREGMPIDELEQTFA